MTCSEALVVTQRNAYVEDPADDATPKRDVPALPRSSVYRDRLRVPEPTDLATELGKGSIVVVTGPGGAGKSTLMAAWASELSSQGAGIGWASLGSDDNDPGTLWTTLLGAFRDAVARGADAADLRGDTDEQRAAGEAAGEALASMTSPGPRAESGFVGRLARVLRHVPYPLWLLLDDVHLVRDPTCLESLNLLLRWVPARVHIVLGARADPAIHLPRLAPRGPGARHPRR